MIKSECVISRLDVILYIFVKRRQNVFFENELFFVVKCDKIWLTMKKDLYNFG